MPAGLQAHAWTIKCVWLIDEGNYCGRVWLCMMLLLLLVAIERKTAVEFRNAAGLHAMRTACTCGAGVFISLPRAVACLQCAQHSIIKQHCCCCCTYCGAAWPMQGVRGLLAVCLASAGGCVGYSAMITADGACFMLTELCLHDGFSNSCWNGL
jgi:hypothetical protein